jgi:hypothetical protein
LAAGRDSLDRLDSDKTRDRITAIFAPYLIARPDIEVVYNDSRVKSRDNIEHEQSYDLQWEHGGVRHSAVLRVIERKTPISAPVISVTAQAFQLMFLTPRTL